MAASAIANASISQSGSFHYTYHDQRVSLSVDTTRVAVFKDRAQLGPDASDGMLPGWSMVPLPEADASRRSETFDERMRAAAADADAPFVSPVFLDANGDPMHVTSAILVRFHEDVTPSARDGVLQTLGATRSIESKGNNIFRVETVEVDGIAVLSRCDELIRRAEVAFAEPDMVFTVRPMFVSNDPLYSQSWPLENSGQSGGLAGFDLGAPEAWDITTGSSAIKVVVIDTGVQPDHPDLNLDPGYDVTNAPGVNGGPAITAWDNHGTAVAGCISGKVNNGIGSAGIAPGVKVVSVRTFIMQNSSSWSSQASWTVDALNKASAIGARVTSNSNGYGFSSAAIDTAYQSTYNAGIIHFAATGNSGTASISYPASIPVVNAIGAVNRSGTRSSFSQYGAGIDFVAPGESVVTTDRTGTDGYVSGDYATVNGTSFATPYAAGVAALVLSADSTLTPSQVESLLRGTTRDLGTAGYDITYGWGALDAGAAVAAATFTGSGVKADFDGNGTPDIIWTDAATGQRVLWLYDGDTRIGGGSLGTVTASWRIEGVVDFNEDGSPDIVWTDTSTGQRVVWYYRGTIRLGGTTIGTVPTNWQIGAFADFNGDGHMDIVWSDTTTGQRVIWFYNGPTRAGGTTLATIPANWQIDGAADFNGDDESDIVWTDTSTGQRVVWFYDGTTRIGGTTLANVPTSWHIDGLLDFNHDGSIDLLWTDSSTGQRVVWFMNGTTHSGGFSLGTVPTNWRIGDR